MARLLLGISRWRLTGGCGAPGAIWHGPCRIRWSCGLGTRGSWRQRCLDDGCPTSRSRVRRTVLAVICSRLGAGVFLRGPCMTYAGWRWPWRRWAAAAPWPAGGLRRLAARCVGCVAARLVCWPRWHGSGTSMSGSIIPWSCSRCFPSGGLPASTTDGLAPGFL